MSQLDLIKKGISVPKNIETTDVKKVAKKIASINNAIVDLIDLDEKADGEMKKLWSRQREIRQAKKIRQEKRLLLLGERIAYFKEMKALGVSVKHEKLTQITTGAASKKMLVEAGVN